MNDFSGSEHLAKGYIGTRGQRSIYVLIAVAIIATLSTVVVLFAQIKSDAFESKQFEDAIDFVGAAAPSDVVLIGSVAHAVVGGDDEVVAYVVNGVQGEREVLCRGVVATGDVSCIDLEGNWFMP